MADKPNLASVFDHRSDGLARTAWFPVAKAPERAGVYEVCAWVGADVTRCRWDGENWWTTARLATLISVGYWRGITRESYLGYRRRMRANGQQPTSRAEA